MATLATGRRCIKYRGSIRLHCQPKGEHPGVATITMDETFDHYRIYRAVADFGEAFTVDKVDMDRPWDSEAIYHVVLSEDDCSCDCLCFQRHGNCKHIVALQALRSAGKL